jgi:predicted GIY-YIG superfamily endonuclease
MPLASGGGTQKQRGPHGRVEPLISPAENFVTGPIRVYILELEDGCWYVGQAHDPERRLARHRKGNAAQWTAANKPLRISQVLPETFDSEQAAALFEDAVTLDLMRQHGWRNVRGGGYCDPSEAAILRALEGKLDLGVRSA